jgi:hypothetical protein
MSPIGGTSPSSFLFLHGRARAVLCHNGGEGPALKDLGLVAQLVRARA